MLISNLKNHPVSNIKNHLADLFTQDLQAVAPEHAAQHVVVLERSKQTQHGDYACNLAMQLAKPMRRSPRDLAQALINALPPSTVIGKVEIAGAGFINIFIEVAAKQQIVSAALRAGDKFGHVDVGAGRTLQVEFVSANPTGPLHIGHGRGAAVGDCLCRILSAAGWRVTREFYYNDAGAQIENLTFSVELRCNGIAPDNVAWPDNGYRGDYIMDVARAYLAREAVVAGGKRIQASGDVTDSVAIQQFAVAYLRQEQDEDLQAFRINFDVYSLESALYTTGRVEEVVSALVASGHTYQQDDALWLRTTDFGDDKDRVMRKSDGTYTYFVPDVAYHLDKWRRGFTRVINEQGADHHSTITRVRAGLQALNVGIPQGWPEYVLHQMVTVLRNGEEVKISKRAGSYVTLRDLIDEVGCDATRYFMAARHSSTHLVFDIDLAKSQSNENPVYYIQYAHARICSVLAQWGGGIANLWQADMSALNSSYEQNLLQRIIDFPQLVENAAADLAPHLIAFYLKDLAADLHSYYNATRFLVEDENIKLARLALIAAVAQVMKNGLDLLGVSAPEKMSHIPRGDNEGTM
ncbi:MAG: arginine--tRNA ligase [Candidatus Nitrotoga sp.]